MKAPAEVHPELGAFLDAIDADPSDRTTRLVLADLLDERGFGTGDALRWAAKLGREPAVIEWPALKRTDYVWCSWHKRGRRSRAMLPRRLYARLPGGKWTAGGLAYTSASEAWDAFCHAWAGMNREEKIGVSPAEKLRRLQELVRSTSWT